MENDQGKPSTDTTIIIGPKLVSDEVELKPATGFLIEVQKPQTFAHPVDLPEGTELQSEYVIKSVLGRGGFGVTYIAYDRGLDIEVVVKEYFPAELARRDPDFSVAVRVDGPPGGFDWGLEKFENEAKTMARLRHDNIARVHRVFKANGTAYIVMELAKGHSLKQLLREKRFLQSQKTLDHFSRCLLSGLEAVHNSEVLHRDVNPSNIIIRESDGAPVLLDFGTARPVRIERSQTLFAVLTPGYAPMEQYAAQSSQQGPWTDIYAAAVTIYEIVAGKLPPESIERALDDRIVPATKAVEPGLYRPQFLEAIDWALSPLPKSRPQSVPEWRSMLIGDGSGKASFRPRGTKIFISYRRSDSRHIAGRIYDRLLQDFGEGQIFYDVDSIPMGVDFRSHIKESIDESAVVLAIVGPGWVNAAWTRKPGWFSRGKPADDFVAVELEMAVQQGVPILPILIDGTLMPSAKVLPGALETFPYLNGTAVRAGRDFRADMDRVIAAIRPLRGGGPAATSPAKTEGQSPSVPKSSDT